MGRNSRYWKVGSNLQEAEAVNTVVDKPRSQLATRRSSASLTQNTEAAQLLLHYSHRVKVAVRVPHLIRPFRIFVQVVPRLAAAALSSLRFFHSSIPITSLPLRTKLLSKVADVSPCSS